MAQKNTKLIVIGIIAILVLAFLWQGGYLSSLRTGDVLGVSQINIDPQNPGYEDQATGAWRGTFWNVFANTANYGSTVFYKFDSSQLNQPYANHYVTTGGQTYNLTIQSDITVNVVSGTPYIAASLQAQSWQVSPLCYAYHSWPFGWDTFFKRHFEWNPVTQNWDQFDSALPPQDVPVWTTNGLWTVYIPLDITVTKNQSNNIIPFKVTGDTSYTHHVEVSGPSALVPITFVNPSDPTEQVEFRLQGMVNTGQLPQFDSMVIFRNDSIFAYDTTLQQDVIGTTTSPHVDSPYMNYWWGWLPNNDGSIYIQTTIQTYCPGVVGQWGWPDGYASPRAMSWFADPINLGGTPGGGSLTGKSLMTWLAERHQKLSTAPLGPIDKWGKGFTIQNNQIKIYADTNVWLWQYTLRISTEAADTVVWRPSLALGHIVSAVWDSTGTDTADISPGFPIHAIVQVQNTASDGRLILTYALNPATAPLDLSQASTIFAAGQTLNLTVTASNNGPPTVVTGTLTIGVVNENGAIGNTKILRFTLEPGGVTHSLLQVHVTDSGTGADLSGIVIVVEYGSTSAFKSCSAGYATFDLQNYAGSVKYYSLENVEYNAHDLDTTTVQAGLNPVSLQLIAKGAIPPSIPWALIVLVAAFGIAFAVMGVYSMKKKRAPTTARALTVSRRR